MAYIGRVLNRDLSAQVNKLSDEVDQLKDEVDQVKTENEKQMRVIDMNDANFIRTTILDFANSLRQGQEHTQEEYDHVIDLNDQYEGYIIKYNVHNGRFTQAYKYILRCYEECLEGHGPHIFLA